MKKKKWLMPLLRRRFLVALLILIQVLLFVYFLWSSSTLSSVLARCLSIISVVVALLVLSGKGESSYKLAWIFLILIFPVVGGVLYVAFDEHFLRFSMVRRVSRAEAHTRPLMTEAGGLTLTDSGTHGCIRYLSGGVGFPAYTDTETCFLPSGEEFLAHLKEELCRAEQYIFLEYFIIEHGEMWDGILEILHERIRAGVRVRIIYDDMGCFLRLPHKYEKLLRGYGFEVARFNPFVPFFSAEQNNRDHRKIAVIDGRVAFTGGINLADEYIGAVEPLGKWADTAVMVKGRAAWSFALMFLQMWEICTKKTEDIAAFLPVTLSARTQESKPAVADVPRSHSMAQEPSDAASPLAGVQAPPDESNTSVPSPLDSLVLPYADSPMDTENVGALVYRQIIESATRYVYITTPYLIIDDQMQSALTVAAKRGVDVRIITPRKGDKRLVHMTTRSHYYSLYESGVRIYEYAPGFMHAKMVVADDQIATVGSVNFDYRSFYLHFECGALLYQTETVKDVKARMLSYMEESEEILPRKPGGNLFARLGRALFRLLSPLL